MRTPIGLVEINERFMYEGRAGTSSVSAPNFEDWRRQSKSIQFMSTLRGGPETILGLAEPVRTNMYAVSGDYFRLFEGTPVAGRTFLPDESVENGAPVCVVSYTFWQEQLGGRRDLSGVHLSGMGIDVHGRRRDAARVRLSRRTSRCGSRSSRRTRVWAATATTTRRSDAWRQALPSLKRKRRCKAIAERLKLAYPDAQRGGRREGRRVARHARRTREDLFAPAPRRGRRRAARRVRESRERQSRARRRAVA